MAEEMIRLDDVHRRIGRSRWTTWRRLREIEAEMVRDPADGRRRLVRLADVRRLAEGGAAA